MLLEYGGLGGNDYSKLDNNGRFSSQQQIIQGTDNKGFSTTEHQSLSDSEMIKNWENSLSQKQREFLNRAKRSNKYNIEHIEALLHNNIESGRITNEDLDRFVSYVEQLRKSRTISDDQATHLLNKANEFVSNGFSFPDALNKAARGERISDRLLDIETGDTKEITNAIFACIDKGNNIFDPNFKISIGDVFLEDSTLSDGFYWESLPQEKKDEISPLIKERCKEKVQQSIETYVSKGNNTINSLVEKLFSSAGQPVSLDEQNLLNYFKIYIQADNYQQPTEERTNIQDKKALKENFKAFCSTIGYKVDDVDEDLLKRWKEKREQEYKKNRQRIENHNRAINERRAAKKLDKVGMHEHKENKSIDLKTATGAEIARNANLGRNVPQTFNPKLNGFLEGEENQRLKSISFNLAWTNFLKNNSFLFKNDNGENIGISSILTENKMHEIFDVNQDNPSVNYTNLDKFLDGINYSEEEKGEIREVLLSFPGEFNKILNDLYSDSGDKIGHIHETVNNHAIGAVIDNVKNIFSGISEKLKQGINFHGFEFSGKLPAKIDGDNLVMSGTLDGSTVKVRYNLSSGQLYMSSFITETNGNPPIITVGDNEPNDPIGSFIPFNDILKDYYKSPAPSTKDNSNNGPEVGYKPISQKNKGNMVSVSPLSSQKMDNSEKIGKENISNYNEILNQKIKSIGGAVQDRMQSQSKKNSVVSKFLKTFNILRDEQTNPIYFEGGCNMFDALQIISNSDADTLDEFQKIMGKLMEYSGLERGENNDTQKQDWKDELSENNEDGKLFKDVMSNFEKEKIRFEQKNQFGMGDNLGFADIIVQRLSNNQPDNKKLDIDNIKSFSENIYECSGLAAMLSNKARDNDYT